jgi:hypothetical protein
MCPIIILLNDAKTIFGVSVIHTLFSVCFSTTNFNVQTIWLILGFLIFVIFLSLNVSDFLSLFIQEKFDRQTVTDGKLKITEFVLQKHYFCMARVARMNSSQKVKISFPLLNEMISFLMFISINWSIGRIGSSDSAFLDILPNENAFAWDFIQKNEKEVRKLDRSIVWSEFGWIWGWKHWVTWSIIDNKVDRGICFTDNKRSQRSAKLSKSSHFNSFWQLFHVIGCTGLFERNNFFVQFFWDLR